MALGKTKKIENQDARFGAEPHYWFLKVQAPYGAEEYWLLTGDEVTRLQSRAANNKEDVSSLPDRGHFVSVNNQNARFGAALAYYGVRVLHEGAQEAWFLTDYDMERIRRRVESNAEDIEANREGWLADLLD